ncbi:MAG: hypothetical protein V4436_00580, partial [Patescibacteria group bacterium]
MSIQLFGAHQPSMTCEQTVQFMIEKGVRPFDRLHWDLGDPLLVVFREELRWKMGKNLPTHQLPSVVRLEKVMTLETKYNSLDMSGWLNYFAID